MNYNVDEFIKSGNMEALSFKIYNNEIYSFDNFLNPSKQAGAI